MNHKRILATLAAAGCIACFPAKPSLAQDSTVASVEASTAAVEASGMVVDGSAQLIRAGGTLVVAGITAASDVTLIVLRDAATGSEASIRFAADAAHAGSLAVGQAVSVVVEAAGASLIIGGRLVAFIPNEVGRALVYGARSTQI